MDGINCIFKFPQLQFNTLGLHSNMLGGQGESKKFEHNFILVKRYQSSRLEFFFPCYRLPILCSNSSSPVQTNSHAGGCFVTFIHPETCKVSSSLSSCKCKLTMSHIFLVMEIIPVRRCYLWIHF